MPAPHRIQVKLHFERGESIPMSAFVPVFHRWIQRNAVEDLLIDVHNYAHIHHGTGILLVGHEGDYAIDAAEGQQGLVYRLKRGIPGGLAEALKTALRRVAVAATLLEEDPALRGKLTLRSDRVDIAILGRLAYPNDVRTFEEIKAKLSAVIRAASGDPAASVARIENDPREPLAVRATISSAAADRPFAQVLIDHP